MVFHRACEKEEEEEEKEEEEGKKENRKKSWLRAMGRQMPLLPSWTGDHNDRYDLSPLSAGKFKMWAIV